MKWRQQTSLGARYTARTLVIFLVISTFFTLLFQWLDRYQWMTSAHLISFFGLSALLVLGCALYVNSHLQLVRPLRALKKRLSAFQVQNILDRETFFEVKRHVASDFDELENMFLIYLRQVQIEHREALVAKNNLASLNKNLERELQLRKTQLEEQIAKSFNDRRIAALGEMAGGIAHEINNPLAILVGRAGQLRKFVSTLNCDQSEVEMILNSIEKTIFRIQEAVTDLETIASNPSTEEVKLLHFGRLLQRIRDLSINRYAPRGIRVDFPETFEATIEAREVELAQAFLYLIENASEAALQSATPWFRVEVQTLDADTLRVRLIDSGQGVPEDVRDKIFQPFFTTKEVGQGRGVGLSLAMSIIDSHGGRLYFDFNQTHTTVCVELPISRQNQLAA
ncbi:sensor histidine kinase [Oligoflexus tunisiensis]|uniref:sensor histidine kinase n=1 Tax=Oligoflexus tunisiensis TaxID=708132 RepID=UPI00159F06D6|nr:ATP-binding protein [Oligoflexus tunisiensis]